MAQLESTGSVIGAVSSSDQFRVQAHGTAAGAVEGARARQITWSLNAGRLPARLRFPATLRAKKPVLALHH